MSSFTRDVKSLVTAKLTPMPLQLDNKQIYQLLARKYSLLLFRLQKRTIDIFARIHPIPNIMEHVLLSGKAITSCQNKLKGKLKIKT
jgi:hypothetical protein